MAPPPPAPPSLDRSASSTASTTAGDGGGSHNDLFAQIEAQRLKREARAAAIERGEVTVEDPREARERALKDAAAKKRLSLRPAR